MINKVKESAAAAVDCVQNGQSVMVGGFGSAGLPADLISALLAKGVTDLVIISNNAGFDRQGVSVLIAAGQVRKLICSYPLTKGATAFGDAYRAKTIELELVPQGTLAERIRCGGAGLGGFLSPITVGTPLAKGKRMIELDGRQYVLEMPLRADLAFVRARFADRIGNLTFHMSGRNFNPVMATAADHVIAEVDQIVAPGALDPESVGTPGIFIDALVQAESRQAA